MSVVSSELVPNNTCNIIVKDYTTLILSTEDYTIKSDFKFSTSRCLIYAETISLSSSSLDLRDTSSPGKSLGLFCKNFYLTTGTATINVSGGNGDASKTKINGSDAGEFVLCVEDGFEDKWIGTLGRDGAKSTGLFVIADGGDGANMASAESGKGGKGGSIRIYIGTKLQKYRFFIYDLINSTTKNIKLDKEVHLPWHTQAARLSQDVFRVTTTDKTGEAFLALFDETSPGSRNVLTAIMNLVLKYVELAEAVQALKIQLELYIDSTEKSKQEKNFRQALTDLHLRIHLITTYDDLTEDTISFKDKFTVLTKDLAKHNLAMSQKPEVLSLLAKTMHDMSYDLDVSTPKFDMTRRFSVSLARLYMIIDTACAYTNARFTGSMSSAKAGVGGAGPTPGADGSPGTIDAMQVAFSGEVSAQHVVDMLAHPDQCQMLLNRANNLFFKGDPDSVSKAAGMYQTLVQRLKFVQTYAESIADAKPSALSLAEAYEQSTINGLYQLQTIQTTAQTSLSRLLSGQDIFGRQHNWAPRLTYSHYQADLKSLTPRMSTLDGLLATYNAALAKNQAQLDTVQSAAADAQKELKIDDARFKYITDANGPLLVAAAQIAKKTPMIKKARKDLKQQITKFAEGILNVINMDPHIFIDAMSMVAMAETKLNFIGQGINAGYKMMSTIKGASGVTVEQDYVIGQLRTISGEFTDLKEGYSTRDDGTKEVDDPGAVKLIMEEEKLNKLITEFQSSVPKDSVSALKKDMEEYKKLVLDRNDAVLTYNGNLNLLAELIEQRGNAKQSADKYGQDKIVVGSSPLPSIYFWLQDLHRKHKMRILDTLSCGAQALKLWALSEEPMTWDTKGDLPDTAQIITLSDNLESQFNKVLETRYGLKPPSPFAGDTSIFYKLDEGEVKTLCEGHRENALDESNQFMVYQTNILGLRATPVYKDTPERAPDDVIDQTLTESPFYGRADVRLSTVAVWLEGVQVKADNSPVPRKMVTAEISHLGDEVFVSTANKKQEFNHDSVHWSIVYNSDNMATKEQFIKAPMTSTVTDSTPKEYSGRIAPLGVFATWQLTLRQKHNDGLDLKNVKNVWLKFEGNSQAFD